MFYSIHGKRRASFRSIHFDGLKAVAYKLHLWMQKYVCIVLNEDCVLKVLTKQIKGTQRITKLSALFMAFTNVNLKAKHNDILYVFSFP